MTAQSTMPPNDTALDTLPLFVKLRGHTALLVGGSAAAAAKARLLLRAGAEVRLIADALAPEMAELVHAGALAVAAPRLDPAHLEGCRLAFDDGADAAASALLEDLAAARGMLVNTIDRPDRCDFIVPAIVDRSPVVVAVSTGGGSPALAKLVRQRIEACLPAGLGSLTRALSACRSRVKEALPSGRARLRFWDHFLNDDRLDRLAATDPDTLALRVAAEVDQALADRVPHADERAQGSVALVGAGPGDPGLLTLAAAEALRTADVVLHDALVSPAVLAMARKEARLIPVGKRAERPSMPQDMINRLILTHARRGERVVRLKGGDPFIFGRGGEEQAFLRHHGIEPRIIGGTTAAFGIAAALGIPLTHRGEARSLRLVTGAFLEDGHLPGDGTSRGPDWRTLADRETTLCLYMSGKAAPRAAEGLIAAGLSPSTPVAAVWNGTMPEQQERFLTLRALRCGLPAPEDDHTGRDDGPVLLIIGSVVAHARSLAGTAGARLTEAATTTRQAL